MNNELERAEAAYLAAWKEFGENTNAETRKKWIAAGETYNAVEEKIAKEMENDR